MQSKQSFHLSTRTYLIMFALAFSGQIAWAVENTWFNTFVFDTITPDPRPVAWMVAASAITATLTTLLMGTLSDRSQSRWGRRRPFILLGYMLWGIVTILFPNTAYLKTASAAIFMVIVADSVMTFFGSTANDAAFNAWTADIATRETRGRVEGVLNLSLFLAQIVTMVAAGIFIDRFGYFIFFYSIGALVMVVGLVAGSLLRDAPSSIARPQKKFFAEFSDLFSVSIVRDNKTLFLLMLMAMLSSIGMQVSLPYLVIYLENFIGLTKSQFGIVGGAVMLGSALVAIPFGILADKWNKKYMIFAAMIISSLGGFLLSVFRSIPLLSLAGFLWQAFSVAMSVASMAWLKDLLPEQDRGKFLGIRMIFWIAIPMVLGSWIGSTLIRNFGTPTISNGQAGFIPSPVIFQVGSLISLLALIPLLLINLKHSASHS